MLLEKLFIYLGKKKCESLDNTILKVEDVQLTTMWKTMKMLDCNIRKSFYNQGKDRLCTEVLEL